MALIFETDNLKLIHSSDGYGIRLPAPNTPIGIHYDGIKTHDAIDLARAILRDNGMLHEIDEGK